MVMAGRMTKIGDTAFTQLQQAAKWRITADILSDPARFQQFTSQAGLPGSIASAAHFIGQHTGEIMKDVAFPWILYAPGMSAPQGPQNQTGPEGPADLDQWRAANHGT